MEKRKISAQKGFTIIEMIVVMAVFLFVIGAAISIFVTIVAQQKRVLSEQQLLNQVSYVEEYMSKALRMATVEDPTNAGCLTDSGTNDHVGYIYLLADKISGKYRGIKFLDQTGTATDSSGNPIPVCEEFLLDTCDPVNANALVLCEKQGTGAEVPLTPSDLQFDPTNPINFAINGMADNCQGSEPCGACNDPQSEPEGACNTGMLGISGQPRVTITMNIKIPGDATEPTRTIQTTVSQRNLNVQ